MDKTINAVQGLDAALGILSVFDTSGAGVTCESDQRTFPKDRSVVRDTKARHVDLRAIEFVAMPDFRVNFNVVGNFAWVDAPATFEGTTVQGYPLLQDIRFRFAGIDGELIDQLWVSKASIKLSGSDNALLHEDHWIGIPFDFEIDFDPVGTGGCTVWGQLLVHNQDDRPSVSVLHIDVTSGSCDLEYGHLPAYGFSVSLLA
jgi:hypothetical protein